MINENFRKKIATLLAAITASILVFSVAYIVAEENHDCTGEDCPVCVCIERCLDNLRVLGTADDSHEEIFTVEKFFEPPIFRYVCLIVPVTLTNQKVRLDD
ncbi:MAG: hypothetical protein IJ685_09025 [Selenomonadaceae bacterium]|nr:hypothetical protein [Selenomonadaceae bacterium]